MKKLLSLLLLSLILTPLAQADNGLTLAQQLEQLKTENQRLRQRIAQLEKQTQQAIDQKQAVYLTKTFDQATRRTIIRSYERTLAVTHGRKQRYWYQVQATPAPKTSGGGGGVQLQLRAPASGGQLRGLKEIRLQADDKTLTLPVTQYTAHRRRSGLGRAKVKLVDETLTLQLTVAQITQLSKAKKVTGQFAGTRFAWTREDYNLFRALALELASLPN